MPCLLTWQNYIRGNIIVTITHCEATVSGLYELRIVMKIERNSPWYCKNKPSQQGHQRRMTRRVDPHLVVLSIAFIGKSAFSNCGLQSRRKNSHYKCRHYTLRHCHCDIMKNYLIFQWKIMPPLSKTYVLNVVFHKKMQHTEILTHIFMVSTHLYKIVILL